MWGNTGSTFLRDEQLKPLQYSLQQISAGGAARAGAAAAVTFIIAAVPITFFLICQLSLIGKVNPCHRALRDIGRRSVVDIFPIVIIIRVIRQL